MLIVAPTLTISRKICAPFNSLASIFIDVVLDSSISAPKALNPLIC